MSATLSGVFELVDRASPALEKIEKRAKSADRALEKLGRRMDRLGNGSATRSMERLDKSMDKAARSAERLSRRMDRLGRQRTRINVNTREVNQAQREIGKLQAQMAALSAQSALTGGGTDHLSKKVAGLENELAGARKGMQSMGREAETLTMKLAKFGAAFYGVTKIVQIIKIPAMIAGVGLLVKWVGALAGGVAALLPKLTDLVGIAGAAPAAFMGMATAMGAVKLSFAGMGEALQGNADAFKKLTPEAQKFVGTLKSMKPIVGELRRASQQGLFPGLEVALQKLKRGVPTIKEMLKATGATVGRGASRFAAGMTTEKALGDMSALNKISNRGLSRMFDTITSLARAFVSLGVAAGPFVDWMSKSIKLWAKHLQLATDNARATGRLGDFFDRTKHSMQTFGSILKNLWQTFRGIGRASRELGDDLWSSADRATKSWATWANSVQGQSWLRNYFDSIKETLHETFGLVGDLFRAFMRLSSDRSMAGLVHKLREMVPLLEKALGDASRLLGGPMLDALAGVMRIFTNGAWLEQFMRLLANVTNLLGFMMEKIPGITAIITAITAVKVFGPAIAAVRTLAASWGLVAQSATAAAAAQGMATGTSMAGGAGAATAGRAAMAAGTASAVNPGFFSKYKSARTPMSPQWTPNGMVPGAPGASVPGAALAAGGGAMAGMKTGAKALSKVAGPIAALFAASDFIGTKGTLGERTQGMLSGATFGLIPGPELGVESRAKGAEKAQEFLSKRDGKSYKKVIGDTRKQISNLEVQKMMASAVGDDDKRDRISGEIRALREKLPGIIRDANADRKQRQQQHGGELAGEFQERFGRLSKRRGRVEAFDNTLGAVRGQIGRLGPDSGRALADQQLIWAKATAGKNKDMLAEYYRFEKSVIKRFGGMARHIAQINGKIYYGTQKEWGAIAEAMASAARRGVSATSAEWRRLQGVAVGALRDSGYGPKEAAAMVAAQAPGATKADKFAGAQAGAHGAVRITGDLFNGGPSGDGLGRIGGSGADDMRARVQARTDAAGGRPSSGGVGLMGAKAGLGGYANKAAEFGLSVTSGGRPGAITSSGNKSYHASGDAIDVSGSAGGMMSFARYAAQNWGPHLEELIYTPFGKGQIKNGSNYVYTGQVASDHYDHVHIADTAPTMEGGGVGGGILGGLGGAMAAINLRGRKSGLGGITGALADRASAVMAAGLSAKLNAATAAGGGGGSSGGGGVMSFDQVARLAESVGLPGITFAQIAQGESSLNPTVVGNDPGGTQGLGLWQITTGFNDDIIRRFGGREAMFNPRINAQAAKAIYDRQGIGAWYGTKYVTGNNLHYQGDGIGWGGWHAKGGDFSVSKPTLLGVGEKGKEHISITPAGKGGGKGGGARIVVNIEKIENHRKGDIKKMIEEEMGMLANELTFVGADHD